MLCLMKNERYLKKNNMDTRLNIRQIQKIVIKYIDRRNDCIVVPNLSFGLLNHEADLAIINKSNRLTEIEIKRSYSDLKADFSKEVFHKDEKVCNFYFALPISIRQKAEELFQGEYKKLADLYGDLCLAANRPAVLYYDDDGGIVWNERNSYVYNGRRLFLEEVAKCARLMSLRYWKLVDTITPEN